MCNLFQNLLGLPVMWLQATGIHDKITRNAIYSGPIVG
jgi:hypothetical protein